MSVASPPVYDLAETRRLVAADPWGSRLGIEAAAVDGPTLILHLELGPEHLNFLDGAHGGALFSLAELAVRVAAIQRGPDPAFVDGHLTLTAGAGAGDLFTATVSDVRVGRALGVFRATVSRSDGRQVGELTATVQFQP